MHLPWASGQHIGSNWIENVNVILVRPKKQQQQNSSKYDYEVCNIESCKINFVEEKNIKTERITPGKRRHLPATNLHESDFAPEWRSILGANLVHQYETSMNVGDNNGIKSAVPIFSDDNIARKSALDKMASNCGKILKPQLALRICAIRCLFQELAILLCTSKSASKAEPWNLQKWQTQVRKDPSQFIKLFQMEPNLRPSIECLFEWWNWLTPTTVGRSPRYDTLFYFCALDSWNRLFKVDVATTSAECKIEWNTLEELLQSYQLKSFLVSPCQLYELARLSSHPWLQWAKQFAIERERNGVRQWIPSISLYKNGTISYLPGDQFYPGTIDLVPVRTPRMYDNLCLEDMRDQKRTTGRMNRIEHLGYWCRIVVDELPGEGGHSAILYDQLPVIRVVAKQPNSQTDEAPKSEIVKIINSKL